MQLLSAHRAPNPRRVLMFIAEKGITGIEVSNVDLNAGAHRTPDFLAKSPLAKVPALVLDDGRVLTETRAICTYLEGLQPEPNLMGVDATERAFIEMADRRSELTLMLQIANAIRHTHPGLAALEQPQFADFGKSQAEKMLATATVFDQLLQQQEWMAGARFSIADITAFCGLEFARGLMKFAPADAGLHALQAWRDKVNSRPSARAL
jgi:glutathione S-transferase